MFWCGRPSVLSLQRIYIFKLHVPNESEVSKEVCVFLWLIALVVTTADLVFLFTSRLAAPSSKSFVQHIHYASCGLQTICTLLYLQSTPPELSL